jgi:hypothetical protein
MAQEFTINSSAIESKINQLLPSQGGFGAGVDFSASTMVIPIVDLTETAEGSDVRADIQTSLSLNTVTAYNVTNTTSTLISTTGYFRIRGSFQGYNPTSTYTNTIKISDGLTTKILESFIIGSVVDGNFQQGYDFNVFLQAGHSITATSASTNIKIVGTTRQIADISGNLINP